MTIGRNPKFDHIVATGGEILHPTVSAIAGGAGLNEVVWDIASKLHTLIVEIGAWNMDTDSFKVVDPGVVLDYTKVISMRAVVIQDSGSANRNAPDAYVPMGDNVYSALNVLYDNLTGLTVARRTGGIFDNATYSSVAHNRGFIFILYKD